MKQARRATFDPNYNLASVTDAMGRRTIYDYDSNDRLSKATDGTSKTVEYRYDLAGNLSTVIYPNGKQSNYEYDPENNLTGISYGNGETSYALEYNALDALTKVLSNTGFEWLFDYDEGNRLVKTQENVVQSGSSPVMLSGSEASQTATFTISRAYDAVSNLTEIKAGDDSTVSYSYNPRYDLTGIDLPGGHHLGVRF